MKITSLAVAAALMVGLVSIQGCGGGGSQVAVDSTTTGKELTDLKAAKDQGIITEAEYERKRKEILRR